MRRIPRPLDDLEFPQDDLNHSDNTNIGPAQMASLPARSRIQHVLLTLRDTLQTSFNSFGLCRLYPRRPSFEPDRFVPSSLLAKTSPTATQRADCPRKILVPPYPFANMTIYRLMSWMHSGSNMISETKVSHLVKDVIMADDFNPKDLENFSVRRSLRELDKDEKGRRVPFQMTGSRPASPLAFRQSQRRTTLNCILFLVSIIVLSSRSYVQHSQMSKPGHSIYYLSNGCGKILWMATKNGFLMSFTPLMCGWRPRTTYRSYRRSLDARWNASSQV